MSGRRDEQRREQLLAVYEARLEEAPRNPQLHLRVGELCELTQKHARAIQHFERASELFRGQGQQACAQAALRRARLLRRATRESPAAVTDVPAPGAAPAPASSDSAPVADGSEKTQLLPAVVPARAPAPTVPARSQVLIPAPRPGGALAATRWEAESTRTETWAAPFGGEGGEDEVTLTREPMTLEEIEELIRVTNQLDALLAARAGESERDTDLTRAGTPPTEPAPPLGDPDVGTAPTQLVAVPVGELPLEATVLQRQRKVDVGGLTLVREPAPEWVNALQDAEFDLRPEDFKPVGIDVGFDPTEPGVAR